MVSDGHAHDHGDHDHHHHHAPSADADVRWLAVALALIAGFMVVEVAGGLLASSLALLSDAAHMLTDAAAIGLALVAARLAARPAGGRFTFGFGRAEILSAQINGAALLVLAGVIAIAKGSDGVRRSVAVPMSLVRERMRDLRPGSGTVYIGWGEYYRCAPLQNAYAAAAYPGFRRRDARLNAPVPASRLRGTGGLDG